MRVRIVAVGRVRESFIREGIAEYTKRLKPYARVEVIETREESFRENFSSAEKERLLQRESEGLIKALGPEYLVALDLQGTCLSSEQLAAHFQQVQLHGVHTIQFVIGGSLGLAQGVTSRANFRLSFGPMTFPHQLFRLLLLEQIYRATTILRGMPYHK